MTFKSLGVARQVSLLVLVLLLCSRRLIVTFSNHFGGGRLDTVTVYSLITSAQSSRLWPRKRHLVALCRLAILMIVKPRIDNTKQINSTTVIKSNNNFINNQLHINTGVPGIESFGIAYNECGHYY